MTIDANTIVSPATVAPNAVTMSRVSMSYSPEKPTLRNISLEIGSGEFVSILGPSGCGKSTILKLMAGLQRQSVGEILVHGQPVDGPPPSVGFMFQRDALLPWSTVENNIAVGLECANYPKADRPRRLKELISLLGLNSFGHFYPHALSGGMRQRVALGRLLAYAPQIYLMDEPFGALDALTKIQMARELLRIWSEQRRAVVFVTHDIEEAVSLSDRVIVMTGQPGTIKATHRVDIERPRDPREVRNLPEFRRLVSQIWEDITEMRH